MNIRNKKAFTIIELIVVIAIIGVLVLFGIPKLTGYVGKAQLTKIMHDTKVMETMMEDELVRNLNVNYQRFVDNGKDLGLLIETNRLFETEGHAKNLQYVPMKGEIDGLSKHFSAQINDEGDHEKLGVGGPVIQEEDEFKEMYERYKIIPEEYKVKAGSKLKGTFYSNENGKVYYEIDKPITIKKESKGPNCSTPLPDYEFEHKIGKIVKYNGNAEHLVIPSHFLVDGECWPVRIIGKGAFMQGSYKSIFIPGTVTTIEDDAFKDLEFDEIYIPGSVDKIGKGAFDGNHDVIYGGSPGRINQGSGGVSYTKPDGGIGTITYRPPTPAEAGVVFNPETGTIVKGGGSSSKHKNGSNKEYIPSFITVENKEYPVQKIAKGAYQGQGLITVILPETLEIIDDYAFSGNQLIEIRIPHSVRHIGHYAFSFNEVWKVGSISGPERKATIKSMLIKDEEQFDKIDKLGNIMENDVKVDYLKGNEDKGPDVKLLNHIWVTSIGNIVIDVEYGPVGSGDEHIPKGYEMAALEDFKFVADNFAPNKYHDVSGYYQYVGDKEYVVIPHIIQDSSLTDYYKMFVGTNVKGVASDNKNITNMSYMFYGVNSETIELKYLDTSNVSNMSYMFQSAKTPILDLLSFDTSKVTNMAGMFQDSSSRDLKLTSFDTSNVTNMMMMFFQSHTSELDLSSFDVSKANLGTSTTTSTAIFYGAKATIGYARTITDAGKLNGSPSKPNTLIFIVKDNQGGLQPSANIPIGYTLAKQEDFQFVINSLAPNTYNGIKGYYKYTGKDEKIVVPHLINGNEMKDYHKMFVGTNVKGVASDNKNITNMTYMFQNIQSETIELEYLDTSNVTNMSYMFQSAKTSILDLLSFDTSKVTNMASMFQDSSSKDLKLTSFDTSSVTNMMLMFYQSHTSELDLSSFDVNKANLGASSTGSGTGSAIFYGAKATSGYARTTTDAGKLNGSPSKPNTLTFIVKDNQTKPQPPTNIPNDYVLAKQEDFQFVINSLAPNTYNGIKGYYKYIGADEKIVIPHLINGNEMKDYHKMFVGTNVKGVASDNKNIINMTYMFQNIQSETIELKYLDTSNVTNMSYMFQSAKTSILDLLTFDTSKVVNMMGMFQNSTSNELKLTSFDTSSVTNMMLMFYQSHTSELDLSSFDVSKANLGTSSTSSTAIFYGAKATIGYARTEADAISLNKSASKPSALTFIVK